MQNRTYVSFPFSIVRKLLYSKKKNRNPDSDKFIHSTRIYLFIYLFIHSFIHSIQALKQVSNTVYSEIIETRNS